MTAVLDAVAAAPPPRFSADYRAQRSRPIGTPPYAEKLTAGRRIRIGDLCHYEQELWGPLNLVDDGPPSLRRQESNWLGLGARQGRRVIVIRTRAVRRRLGSR
jgi:hypothetical protein